MEAWTKWPTFRRQHLEMHFVEWKFAVKTQTALSWNLKIAFLFDALDTYFVFCWLFNFVSNSLHYISTGAVPMVLSMAEKPNIYMFKGKYIEHKSAVIKPYRIPMIKIKIAISLSWWSNFKCFVYILYNYSNNPAMILPDIYFAHDHFKMLLFVDSDWLHPLILWLVSKIRYFGNWNWYWPPTVLQIVISGLFTDEVNSRLAKHPLKTVGRLARLELTSLVKVVTIVKIWNYEFTLN